MCLGMRENEMEMVERRGSPDVCSPDVHLFCFQEKYQLHLGLLPFVIGIINDLVIH